jgi:hypothetical protein
METRTQAPGPTITSITKQVERQHPGATSSAKLPEINRLPDAQELKLVAVMYRPGAKFAIVHTDNAPDWHLCSIT